MENEVETIKVKKRHLILGHPILWCILTLPIAMVLSQLISNVFISIFTSVLPQGNLLEIINSLASSICYVLLCLGFLFIGRKAYGESFKIGFTSIRIKESLILSLGGLVLVALNFAQGIIYSQKTSTTATEILTILISAIGVGFAEEICSRNFVIENAMQTLKNKKYGILVTLLFSSIGFGILHLLNLTVDTNKPFVVFIQVFYALVFGFFFGTIYIRTRNLWGAIIMHSLIDIIGFYYSDVDQLIKFSAIEIFVGAAVGAIMIAISLFMLRKSKWQSINEVWEIPNPKAINGEG